MRARAGQQQLYVLPFPMELHRGSGTYFGLPGLIRVKSGSLKTLIPSLRSAHGLAGDTVQPSRWPLKKKVHT